MIKKKIRFDEPENVIGRTTREQNRYICCPLTGRDLTDPTESDIHYFNLLKAWNKSGSIDFRFTNSHEKTYQVRDSSSKATLFNRLETRLSASKNFLLIISDKTNYDRGILNWEIEKAVDYYDVANHNSISRVF